MQSGRLTQCHPQCGSCTVSLRCPDVRNVKASSHGRVLTKHRHRVVPSLVLVPEYSLSQHSVLHSLALVDKCSESTTNALIKRRLMLA